MRYFNTMRRPARAKSKDLPDDRSGRDRVGRGSPLVRHCDWGMPCLGRPQHRFALLRETALQNVNVDRRIVEQLGGSMTGRSDELKLRFGSGSNLRSMLSGLSRLSAP